MRGYAPDSLRKRRRSAFYGALRGDFGWWRRWSWGGMEFETGLRHRFLAFRSGKCLDFLSKFAYGLPIVEMAFVP